MLQFMLTNYQLNATYTVVKKKFTLVPWYQWVSYHRLKLIAGSETDNRQRESHFIEKPTQTSKNLIMLNDLVPRQNVRISF